MESGCKASPRLVVQWPAGRAFAWKSQSQFSALYNWYLESSVAACRTADTGPQGLQTLNVMKMLEQQCEHGESTEEHRFTLYMFQKAFPIVNEL